MVSVSRRTSSIGADCSLEMHSSQNDNARFFIRKGGAWPLLRKPFAPEELVRWVGAMLAAPPTPTP